jgi:hypothetical protein
MGGKGEKDEPAHGNELRAGQVLESKVVLEETGDTDNLLSRGGLTGATNLFLAEEKSA